ncbi:conserved hypothetical protein [Rippkaea orientalis PCC 8801]|uniref:Ssl1498 family light-harvesting-like protein n=1 Tax=Rippkaea orientalis (strain PCC 8801 / RF-1) TaxID=41431 RepID=B7K1C9_RIPO1|nr:ssl1498 family light-harvesting-like protein [Rippkaea orientalis]ACK66324.1 conserved hypothetical protein [Rippkaea orientalis PCC 8801]
MLEYNFRGSYKIMPNNSTETRAINRPPSDGSELIPAEVTAKIDNKGNSFVDQSLADGYTVDDEGIINNYAIEPEEYRATYPAPYEQRRYLVQGAIAIVFVAFIVWVAFTVS